MPKCNLDNSFVKEVKNEVEKINFYVNERTKVLTDVMSIELKHGRSSGKYSLALDSWIKSYNEDKECIPTLDQIFTTILDESFIRTIDKYSESITDTSLKRKLLEKKYLSFLLNPELERMYLGLDSLVNDIRSNDISQLIESKAVEKTKIELCVYTSLATDDALLASALRLESLAPFLDEKNSSFILELVGDTIKRITSDKSKSVAERKILISRKEAV